MTWRNRLPSPFTLITVAVSVLTLLALAAAGTLFLFRERAAVLRAAEVELDGDSRLLSEHVGRALDGADAFVVQQIVTLQIERLTLDLLATHLLRNRGLVAQRVSQIVHLSVVDQDGVIRFATRPDAVGLDVSERDYFRNLLNSAGTRMQVGEPVISRVTGTRILPASWPVRRDGRFIGAVVATLNVGYFARAFDKARDAKSDGFIALLNEKGTVLAMDSRRWPLNGGTPPELPVLTEQLLTNAEGIVPGISGKDQRTWQLAIHRVPEFGLSVVVASPHDEILTGWWKTATVSLVGLLLVVLVLSGLSLALLRLAQRQRATVQLALVAQQRAEAADRSKSQFLATMSHEIRTPMTSVLGMAELLVAENLTPTQRGYVDTVRRSGTHLLAIINDILDFSRIESGRQELERIDFALSDVIEQMQSVLAPQAAERGLELRVSAPGAPDLVLNGDPTAIRQILINLGGNALKFTSRGQVEVTARHEEADEQHVRLRMEVRDTGVGIPPERQRGLFEPFSQADNSTSRHYGGSGLGLAICKRLVEAMRGTIGVQSEPGVGSLFWFEVTLPRGCPDALAQRDQALPVALRPLHILVVDDVDTNRELLTAMLSRHGHTVSVAPHGEAALAQAAHGGIDVVLMDVQMPVMSGLEATRRIRQLPPPRNSVPILALTANVMASERARYIAAGMNGCLTKPVVWPELFRALAGVVDGHATHPDEPAPSAPPLELEDLPLVDRKLLDGLAERMPPPLLQQLLSRGVENARESCSRFQQLEVDYEAIAREGHKLKGTAGSFGLARIAALAQAIEERAEQGQKVSCLVHQLDIVIDATREAARDLLAAVPSQAR
jgi:signal transduction histidine kinase/DNA-binding response OmpR family regulator